MSRYIVFYVFSKHRAVFGHSTFKTIIKQLLMEILYANFHEETRLVSLA